MPNINKVVYGNTTLIDLTDTTAEAADVAQGKYFYGKDGVKTAGTASGGSGSGGIIYQDLDGYLHLSEDAANVVSIVDTLDTAGGTIRTITGATESGGGGSLDDFLNATLLNIQSSIATVRRYAFGQYWNVEFTVDIPNVTTLDNYAFSNTGIKTKYYPLVTSVGQYAFNSCSKLTSIVLPLASSIPNNCFASCTALTAADFGAASSIGSNCFRGAAALNVLVLRKSDGICAMGGSDSLYNTAFYSGKAGGTIYIPKALYDHLGDGTSLDYKAATNWSTYEGYGTITWAKIEDTIYETQYADGTLIPST